MEEIVLYTIITNLNTHINIMYNEESQRLYAVDPESYFEYPTNKNDDAITIINNFNADSVFALNSYFIDNCYEEVMRRYEEKELYGHEFLLYYKLNNMDMEGIL